MGLADAFYLADVGKPYPGDGKKIPRKSKAQATKKGKPGIKTYTESSVQKMNEKTRSKDAASNLPFFLYSPRKAKGTRHRLKGYPECPQEEKIAHLDAHEV